MLKYFFVLLFGLILLLVPRPVFAAGEFSSSYNVSYEVDNAGITQVTQGITLKNLTDKYYASSFSLTIGATQIYDIVATDAQGPMKTTVTPVGKKTQIKVDFNQQLAGKDKEYPWTLRFKSKDFAQSMGKVWQVSLPKTAPDENLDKFNLTLTVPVGFGDPTAILPLPKSHSEVGGKLLFAFTKEQLLESGVLASFGSNQLFNYQVTYHLENTGVLPTITKVSLPPNTAYQEVLINNIHPKPENVTIDSDGNYIGWFKLGPRENLQIDVTGLVKLYLNRRMRPELLTKEQQSLYTASQKYWEKDNQAIQSKLSEIFLHQEPKTNREKALLINRFVSNYLQYDDARSKNSDFQRFGGLTALNNPTQALCSEFTDLFITLARAANIPAREVVGYAYTANTDLRPLSFQNTVLHAWPEYYDPQLGWVMIDPTWQNTTGGVDYFSKFDLNHFVLAVRGVTSESPVVADQVTVNFSSDVFNPSPKVKVNMDVPSEMFAGFPSQAVIKIVNEGNSAKDPTDFTVFASKLDIPGERSFKLATIPPFGQIEQKVDLRTRSLWQSYEDVIQVKVGDETFDRTIKVKPFFEYQYFSIGVVGVIISILLVYFGILFLHLRSHRKKS